MKWWQRHHLWRVVPRRFRRRFHDLMQCTAEMPGVALGDGLAFVPMCIRYRWHPGGHQSSLVAVADDSKDDE